jgi:hypothetical protein
LEKALFNKGATALNDKSLAFRAVKQKINKSMSRAQITKSVFSFLITSLIIAGFFSVLPVSADDYGLSQSANVVDAYKTQAANPDNNFLSTRLGSIIGLVLSFVGVIFLILMIFAGLSWMTASGNQEKVNKAKDLMINAVIGLVIVMAAYAITAFVGDKLT